MNYTLTLKDGSSTVVSEDKAKQIIEMVSAKKEFIILDGEMFSRSTIAKVERGGILEQIKQVFPAAQINDAPIYNCVLAGTSIQLAIHRLIKTQYPNDWPKRVANKAFREKIRKQLRAKYPDRPWCDAKANEHACLGYKPREGDSVRVASLL